MLTYILFIPGILVPRYDSSTAGSVSSTASLSLWIIIGVIGGITIVAVGLVGAILCYRKCSKKQQQPVHQNVYVTILVTGILIIVQCLS